MMREMKSLLCSWGVVCVLAASSAAGQTPGPSNDAQTMGRGWTALAAGRADEAVSLANTILKSRPRSHAAFTLKVEALSAGPQPITALDEYEAWIPKAGHNVDDRGLLESIALGVLRLLASDSNPAVRTAALEFLASQGNESAVDALRKRSAEGDQRAMATLVERGDASSIQSLQKLVASGMGRDLSAVIMALGERDAIPPQLLQALATDHVPMNRAAIADNLARSKDPNAAALLQSLAQDPDPLVHRAVILARAKNGDDRALTEARAMLASEVPDIRLIAAEALRKTLPQEAEQAVRPLLNDRDGINRFRAAAIVGASDPATVQSVLLEGLGNENPLVQQTAARIAAETMSDDIVLLRQLLRHPDRSVVVQAAGAIAGG
jgi:HEAT repeat protein